MAGGDGTDALATAKEHFARLKRAYERYWAGVERPEPVQERDHVRSLFQQARQQADRQANVAQAFLVRSAQASFLAFDELCTRRAERGGRPRTGRGDRSLVPPLLGEQTAAPIGHAEAPFERPLPRAGNDRLNALYAQLAAHCEVRGQQLPERAAWLAQVEGYLTRAQAQAPGSHLQASLRVAPDGRLQLVVQKEP